MPILIAYELPLGEKHSSFFQYFPYNLSHYHPDIVSGSWYNKLDIIELLMSFNLTLHLTWHWSCSADAIFTKLNQVKDIFSLLDCRNVSAPVTGDTRDVICGIGQCQVFAIGANQSCLSQSALQHYLLLPTDHLSTMTQLMLLGNQTSDSSSSSKFHHQALTYLCR